MTLKSKIDSDIIVAMKTGLKAVVITLRGLKSEVQDVEKNTGADLDDSAVVKVVQKQIKRLNDSIEYAEKANREDLLAEYKAQRNTLSHYLPKQLTEEELTKIIEKISVEMEEPNLGFIMRTLRKDYDGQFDGKVAAKIAKEYV